MVELAITPSAVVTLDQRQPEISRADLIRLTCSPAARNRLEKRSQPWALWSVGPLAAERLLFPVLHASALQRIYEHVDDGRVTNATGLYVLLTHEWRGQPVPMDHVARRAGVDAGTIWAIGWRLDGGRRGAGHGRWVDTLPLTGLLLRLLAALLDAPGTERLLNLAVYAATGSTSKHPPSRSTRSSD